MESKHCISEVLLEVLSLQNLITNSSTKYSGSLLAKIAGVDTIPLLLLKKDGLLSHLVIELNHKTGEKECFESNFFRIESIHIERNCVVLSILRPLNIRGEHTNSICSVIKLIRTSTSIEIDLSCICAVQVLDTELLKRKIVIEPKW